jgi:hypothetical protein
VAFRFADLEQTGRSGRTNRWTGAAVARFASSLVRRSLNEFAPPGQLNRSAAANETKRARFVDWAVGGDEGSVAPRSGES